MSGSIGPVAPIPDRVQTRISRSRVSWSRSLSHTISNGRFIYEGPMTSNRRLLALWLAVHCVCASSIAYAHQITADEARSTAIAERERVYGKIPDSFEVVTEPKSPLTYAELLTWRPQASIWRTLKWKKLLSNRLFWVVQFRIPENTTEITAGGGSWVFVDAKTGKMIATKYFR
jgi:hypothetical protein